MYWFSYHSMGHYHSFILSLNGSDINQSKDVANISTPTYTAPWRDLLSPLLIFAPVLFYDPSSWQVDKYVTLRYDYSSD